MKIGDKIKLIRKYRGLTQQELGEFCGFSSSSARVRIQQYEYNQKKPTQAVLEQIANSLNVYHGSLHDESHLVPLDNAIQTLFSLEDIYGLTPVKINGHIYLSFEPLGFGQFTDVINHRAFLQEWFNAAQQYAPVLGDSKEVIEHKREEYMLWKYEYPNNQRSDEEKEALLKQKEEAERILHELNQKLIQYKDK